MLKLQTEWETRLKLRAEGDKLCVEGSKLYAEGDKLCVEGSKVYAEGDKLNAEGDIQWFDAVIKTYGNVVVSWKGLNCVIEGDEYKAA